MKISIYFAIILFITPVYAYANDNDTAIEQVMNRLKSSFEAGDDTYAIDVMYQPVLELMGGRKVALASTKKVRENMKTMNAKIVSWTAKKPYKYLTTKTRQYVLIPYESVININNRQLHTVSYQLGIKSNGMNWQFLTGDNLNDKMYERFFPDFPKDVKLPPVVSNFR